MRTFTPLKTSLAALLLAALTLPIQAQDKKNLGDVPGYEPWPEEAVESFYSIPVQHDGRVKPMGTVAYFEMLAMRSKTHMTFRSEGEKVKIDSMEWLMDTLLRTDLAKEQPVITVDDSDAVTNIGAQANRKRDFYSYNDLKEGRGRLADLGTRFNEKGDDADALEAQVVLLAQRVNRFEYMASTFNFAVSGQLVNPDILPEDMQEMAAKTTLSELLERMPNVGMDEIAQMMQQNPATLSEDMTTVLTAMKLVFFYAQTANSLHLFPPSDGENEKWYSPGELIQKALENEEEREWALERLRLIENMAASVGEPEKFTAAVHELREFIEAEAEPRGEMRAIPMEVNLYTNKYLENSKVFYVIAFFLMCLMWVAPNSRFGKYMSWGTMGAGLIATGLLTIVITMRCIIRMRAPITNLFETFLFIAGLGFILGLLIEFMVKEKRIALSAGVVMAMVLVLLSGMFLTINAADTMPQLEAVLDTNFWLWVHVITINVGYCGGLLAAMAAHCYIIGKLFNIGGFKNPAYRDITKIVYGIACFSLFFSLVGTVLGGIWANYSWGRFWGWDPKENGALMIVLWTLVMLHARLGGYIRDIGINVGAIILGMIIAFSWFGTNALGVGLHSYGFAQGIWETLYTYWGIEIGMILLAGVVKMKERALKGGSGGSGKSDGGGGGVPRKVAAGA